MARVRSRSSSRNRGGRSRSYSGRGRAAPVRSRSVRGYRAGSARGTQTVKLVLGFDPTVGSGGAFKPGVPGTVGISAQGASNGKAKF